MRKIRWIGLLMLLNFLLHGTGLAAGGDVVVSLGSDLTKEQREQMLDLFHIPDQDSVKIVYVTNEEEREYLKGMVSEDKIGTKAISSAYVEILGENQKIQVETYNIDWVSKEMLANALVTAGVENAKVIAAAPFAVSGTAALTGVMKAFEAASGKDIPKEAKSAANEELVVTGQLGEELGEDKAAAFIKEVKERIVKDRIKDPEEIKRVIVEVAARLNIKLSESQINSIIDLMKKIANLDLDIQKIRDQLSNMAEGLDQIKKAVDENKGLLQRIIDMLRSFFRWLRSLLK